MKKVNICRYIFIIFILIIILIPQANAKTKTYHNYYFFLESYTPNDLKNPNNTTNYTAFPPINKFGIDQYVNATKITLERSCQNLKEDSEDSCWTYDEFYKKLYKVETDPNSQEIDYTIEGNSHLSKVLQEGQNSYFTHGSYSSDKGITWSESGSTLNKKFDFNGEDSLPLSCASISTENELRSKKVDKDYFYVIIDRNLGTYTINDPIGTSNNISNCPNDDIYAIENNEKQQNVLSPVLYKYTYTETEEVCDPNLKKTDTGKCNSSDNELISTCQKETIETSNSRADVKIDQNGTVSNILTPDSVYQGGGFKFGFVYYNEISWDFAEDENIYTTLGSTDAAKEEITAAMKEKIQNIEAFKESIILDNITFGNETIDSSLIQKSCQRSGEFNSGETVTTICTFYLPNSIIEPYTGKITYSTAIGTNYGINNKYYTPLTYEGKYNIKATLKNLDTLIDDEKWTGDWSLTFDGSKDDSCQIDVVKRLYETTYDSKYSYAFLYRPIDLNNPFPNRNAGVNWYNWIQNINNQERLKETYTKLQYQVKLDNKTTYAIKNYNSNHNYLNWDEINEDEESSFIQDYFTIYRKNIEGDTP